MRESFRGIVWPRVEQVSGADGVPVYRYPIVGMLVTDTPIEGTAAGEVVLVGDAPGLAAVLARIDRGHAERTMGDAADVMMHLADLEPGPAPTDPR